MATLYANSHLAEEPDTQHPAVAHANSPAASIEPVREVADKSANKTANKTAPPRPGKLAGRIKAMFAPVFGVIAFLALWAVLAPQAATSLGALPGPGEVARQGSA